jgi:hypothetical protein
VARVLIDQLHVAEAQWFYIALPFLSMHHNESLYIRFIPQKVRIRS